MEQPKIGLQVPVTFEAIINEVHNHYGRIIAPLVQENSQLTAACEQLNTRVIEAENRLNASAGQPQFRPVVDTGPLVPADETPVDPFER